LKKSTIKGLPLSNSAATPPGPFRIVEQPARQPEQQPARPRRRKGPVPGTVDRFGESDRALYPELKRLMREERMSINAAALKLADEGKVEGVGTSTPGSRAHRLAHRYRKEDRS
jgi:hypothetical protein